MTVLVGTKQVIASLTFELPPGADAGQYAQIIAGSIAIPHSARPTISRAAGERRHGRAGRAAAMKKRVLAYRDLPTFLPLNGTVAWGLLLDRLKVPAWVWGAWITLMILLWLGVAINLAKQQLSTPVWQPAEAREKEP